MIKYDRIASLVELANARSCKISDICIEDQAIAMNMSEEEIIRRMDETFEVMMESTVRGMDALLRSTSGLTGGEGARMQEYNNRQETLCGSFLAGAMARAMAVSNCNAAMGRVVAAPTAGSCGIMPGALVSMLMENRARRENIVRSMFTAGAFGMVLANRFSVAGAEGGCQAECGSASGMTPAALVELQGGTPVQCAMALAMCIKNELGLVCDPVAGLVEIPCIKRNTSGLMIAFSSADMALAGIPSYIPADECIDAMREVGLSMPCSLKETALGGLAATPTGRRLMEQVFGNNERR